MKKLLTLILCSFMIANGYSQESKLNLGVGFGLDYGGIGTRIAYNPVQFIGIFGGVGFNLLTLGYNAGAQVRIPLEKRVTPFLTGMYGYNGIILVINDNSKNETFYGPTFGGGIEIRLGRKSNFINAELLFPIHPDLYDRVDQLKNSGVSISDPLPISICIGYHFSFL